MKVLFFSSGLTPWHGGSAVSEASLIEALQTRTEVQVLCREGLVEYSFCKEYSIPTVYEYHPREFITAYFKPSHPIAKFFKEAAVVHLNGHWRWENYLISRLCRKYSKKYVLHPRGMLLVGHRRKYLKQIFNFLIGNAIVRNAAKVIALSKFELRHFEPYHVDEGRAQVLPNGIVRSAVAKRNTALATEIFPKIEKPFVLYIGRVELRKNLFYLVEQFGDFTKGGGQLDLVIMGPSERNHKKEVGDAVEELGLAEKTHFFEPIYSHAKYEFMSKAKAVVYPSIEEPFGRVPFEALIAGSLPLVPQMSGSAEYLDRFLPDCVFDFSEPNSLSSKFRALEKGEIPHEPSQQLKAQEWVRTELAWGRITDRVLDLYSSVTT